MTENAFPFEGAVEESAGGDRRKMVMFAVVGALLVALMGYYVVLPAFSGGDTSTPITTVRKAPAKKTPAKKPAAKKKAPVQPAQYNDLAGRKNPFFPLWVEPKPEAATTTTTGTTTAPSTDTAAPATTDGTTTSTGSTTTVGTQRVALMTVFTKDGVSYAQTKVGEVVYLPRVGQAFAGTFKLLAVSTKTATYLYGDEQFTLSVGQEVLK